MSSNSVPLNSKTLFSSQQDPQNSPNKTPKTLNSSTPSKGKSKVEDETCGICLSEQGKSIRGCIDSCDHYFCFVCIMEWAKVESRCPMCKRRFGAIRRPVKDGVFAAERIVNVPVRNQVHHHFGNVTTGPQDQYAEVQCTVCHGTSDECLLLLCDLCDSASHTYCVGLGGTVPEGDWFCQDCTFLRDEHARDDKDLDADGSGDIDSNWGNQTSLRNHPKPPSVEAPVSIFDIVRESSSHGVERFSTNRSRISSTCVHDDGIRIAAANVEHSSEAQYPAECGRSQLGARTLQQCRSVHGRIRALRENWDKIRHGSLSFSSIATSNQGLDEVQNCTSQPNFSSCSTQQVMPQKSSSSNAVPNIGKQDTDKAWKMMTVAKSIEKKKCTNNVSGISNGSKRPFRNIKTPKESGSARSTVLSSFKVGNKVRDGIKLGNSHRDCLVAKHNDKHKFHMYEREKLCTVPNLERYPATCSTETSKLSTIKMAQCSDQVGMDLGNIVNLPPKNIPGTYADKKYNCHGSSTCRSSGSVAENCYTAKQDVNISSSCNPEEDTKVEEGRVDGKTKIESDAKSDIQSLVKLNLKLISTDKKLDTNTFKEVARLATHSILGACGIGAPKLGARTFQSSICSHADRVRRSTLMPSSCRECFFVFVKDVVSTIMLEKRTCIETSC